MNQKTVTVTKTSYNIGGLLLVLFVGLKLTDNIDWSWWWVTSPLWIPIALWLAIMVLVTGAYALFFALKHVYDKVKK